MPKKAIVLLCGLITAVSLWNCAGTGEARDSNELLPGDNVITGNVNLSTDNEAQDVAVFPQLGHSNIVISVAFSPDGKQALSGSGDNTVKLWDTATGREIRTFSGRWLFP